MRTIEGRDTFKALESKTDEDGNEWITIIKEGTSVNGRNYKRSTLERAVENHVYDGARMFVDHSDGPPLKRGVRELVSGIETTKLDTSFEDGKARIRGQVTWFDDSFKDFVDRAKKHMGASHDAILRGTRTMRNGRRFEDIDEIKKVHSVDWVVYPSAGGGFELGLKEGVEMTKAIDWDSIDEEMLKEHKPDLYKKLVAQRSQESEDDDEDEDEDDEEEVQESVKTRKVKKAPKARINLKNLESEITSMVSRAVENVTKKEEAKAEARTKSSKLINESTLPSVVKNRLTKQFSATESFDEEAVKEAIEEAKTEVAALIKPRVRSMGLSGVGAGNSRVVAGRAHEGISSAFGFDPLAPVETKKTDKEEEN